MTERGLTSWHTQEPILWHWLLRKGKSFIAGRQEAKLKSVSLIQGLGRDLRGTGGYVEVLAGQVSIGGLWNLAVCGKIGWGTSAPGLPGSFWTIDISHQKGFWCLGPGHVLVLWFWGRGETGSRYNWRSEFSALCMLRLHDLWFCSVVWKRGQYLVRNRVGPVWACSMIMTS